MDAVAKRLAGRHRSRRSHDSSIGNRQFEVGRWQRRERKCEYE
jgi:hypothetical protein